MKIYIAARTSDREEVKKLNRVFEQRGYEVLDWTWHKNIKPYSKHTKIANEYSIEDMENVKKADIFVLLTNQTPGTGSTSELGAAISFNRDFKKPKIYVLGEHVEENMFYYHPAVNLRKSIEEVLSEL